MSQPPTPQPPMSQPFGSTPAESAAFLYDLLVKLSGTRHTYAIKAQAETDWHEFPTLLSAFEYLEHHLLSSAPLRSSQEQ